MKIFPKVLQAFCLMLAMLCPMAAGQERDLTANRSNRLKAELEAGNGAAQGNESRWRTSSIVVDHPQQERVDTMGNITRRHVFV